MLSDFQKVAIAVGEALKKKSWKLVTAESCTGGLIAAVVTSIAGSSDWFDRGFVTYSNEAKQEVLGVTPQILSNFGAVSEQTAQAMVKGALSHSHAQVGISVTGIAGPTGEAEKKPVGMVCFAWLMNGKLVSEAQYFQGDRTSIRTQTVNWGLARLVKLIDEK